MIPFTIALAWRETRAGWRHFLYFFLCIALGVGALVAVSLFGANVEQAVNREARSLMGGDLEIRLSRPMSRQGLAVLESLSDRGARTTHVSELIAMAARAGAEAPPLGQATQIVELKAVGSAYPFYGALRSEPARPLPELLGPTQVSCGSGPCLGALVQESLLIRMGISVGDRLRLGQATFVITGVVLTEPDRMTNMFSLGPRVIISQEGLSAAELVQPGSRVRERYLLKLPASADPRPLLQELRGRLAGETPRISAYQDAQPQLKQFLDQLSRYLGLIGLTALFVGGIGVATSVQAFVREKLHTIAVLKTIGADSATVLRAYLGQALFLGLLGSTAGAAAGVVIQQALPGAIGNLFGTSLLEQIGLSTSPTVVMLGPVVKGITLGLGATVLFTLWPLLRIRGIRPILIFRREVVESEPGPDDLRGRLRRYVWCRDPTRAWTVGLIGIGLAGLSVWQAGSWKAGLLFIGALASALILLGSAAHALVRLLKHLPQPSSVSLRQAVGNLQRPGSHSTGVMVSIGIGIMVILTVSLVERSLTSQIGAQRPSNAPTFFFIDIQPDQKDGFLRLLHERTGDLAMEAIPLVRSRLHAVKGELISADIDPDREEQPDRTKEERRTNWYRTREYVLTFLDRVPKDNRIVKGAWWDGSSSGKPLLSIEEEAAEHLGVKLGDTVEFDIQGASVEAEVASIRKVEWGNLSTNFYMILSPGSLEGAPFTYVVTTRVERNEELPLQQAVVAAFPNVTAINLRDVTETFASVLDRLSLAIRSVAAFCVLAGVLVMAASLAATRYRRLYEMVILKALGATRGVLARSFAAEYALLGLIAGFVGVALASALSWGTLHFFFDLPWRLHPDLLAQGLVLTVLLTLSVGFLSTYRLLRQPPLEILRHE